MTGNPPIRLGTRGSDLAMWQAGCVRDLVSREAPARDVEIVTVKTLADRFQEKKLDELGRTGVFTAELDLALREGEVDIAVHSLKDVETTLAEGIALVAVLPRGPIEDVLVGPVRFEDLPAGARIGTGSVRRRAGLLKLRPDLSVVPVRGNVPTRIAKLDAGEYDALLMARAGLVRLGLAHRIATVFPAEDLLPAVGQGAVAVTARAGDEAMARLAAGLDHEPTRRIVTLERACLAKLGGGCNVPLGVFCRYDGEVVRFRGAVLSEDGSDVAMVDIAFPLADLDPVSAGEEAASALLAAGADGILPMLDRGADAP